MFKDFDISFKTSFSMDISFAREILSSCLLYSYHQVVLIHVETIVLLSKLDSKKYISVELPMDDMDLTSAESKATYKQIKTMFWKSLGLKYLLCTLHKLRKSMV